MALKGLGYEVLLFTGVSLLLIVSWIFLYSTYSTLHVTFLDIAEDDDTIKMLNYFERGVYFSLFFLIIIGFLWVQQRSAGPGGRAYG